MRNPLPSKRARPSVPGNQTKPLESTRIWLTVVWSPSWAENTVVGSCSARAAQTANCRGDTTSGDVPESCAGVERLHLKDAIQRESARRIV